MITNKPKKSLRAKFTTEGYSTYGSNKYELISDMLIAKKNKNNFDVIAMSLYGSKADIQKVTSKSKKTDFSVFEMGKKPKHFFIDKGSNFDTKEDKGKYSTRLTMVRKKDLLLDQTEKKSPIVILPGSQSHKLKATIFEYVRDSVVAPLFPDLTNPNKLSKELFITPDKAKIILENVNQQTIVSPDEKIAADGIAKYYQWVDYLYSCLKADSKINNLEVFAFDQDVLAYEIDVVEDEIREYITAGIQQGIISISNNRNYWNHYSQFDTYMGRYAKILKKVIESQSEPIHRKGDVRPHTKAFLSSSLGRVPMQAQEEAIEAMAKSISYQKKVNIVGEPGVGKTLMMSTTAYLDAVTSKKPLKGLVLSPDHLVQEAWEEEVKTTLKGVEYHHIRSLKDLIKYENEGYLDDTTHRLFILGQNIAKNGYSESPKIVWNKHKRQFSCPDCNTTVTKKVKNEALLPDDPKFIDVPVPIDFFATQRYNNRSCKECGSILWGVHNKNTLGKFKDYIREEKGVTDFLYSSMGFIPRDRRSIELESEKAVRIYNEKKNKNTKARIAHLREVQMILEGEKVEKKPISPHKVPVAYYIKKKLKNRFSHLILDEYHEYQSSTSSRSEAAAQVIASVPKVITGTGTMMNGYAKSRFMNDFMLFPEKMKKAGFNIGDVEKYQVAFGVTEKRYRLTDDGKKVSLSPKAKPGISPIIFPLFLQDSTVFISMEDLKTGMPDLKHEVVEVEMVDELKKGKEVLEKTVKMATKGDKKLFKSLMPTLYSYLDMPTVEKEVKNIEGDVIYTTSKLDLMKDKKMEALKKIVRDEKLNGKRTIVYTNYTSDGINNYIKRKLQEDGYSVTVLNKESEFSNSCDGTEKKVKKDARVEYVKDEVAKGTDVLVVNPTLVQTGTNLVDFASIVYYQMSYQVYTVRQADRRTWRIGQTQDCTIYYLYYKDSFQADIASLMATKIVASESIEDNMDSKGLDAITNDRTPEEELAKKFYERMSF